MKNFKGIKDIRRKNKEDDADEIVKFCKPLFINTTRFFNNKPLTIIDIQKVQFSINAGELFNIHVIADNGLRSELIDFIDDNIDVQDKINTKIANLQTKGLA